MVIVSSMVRIFLGVGVENKTCSECIKSVRHQIMHWRLKWGKPPQTSPIVFYSWNRMWELYSE